MKNLIITLCIISLSCNKVDVSKSINYESKVVVEGWIEEGDVPIVILSNSIPISITVDSSTVLSYSIRSAKITVSDGQKTEVLRLRTNYERIPPYMYYGSDIIGKVGGRYTLKIEYLDKVISATTSIPRSVPILSANYEKENPNDLKGFISIKFNDPLNEPNFYQIQTKLIQKDSLFIPALFGNLSDAKFNASAVAIKFFRGRSFSVNDTANYKPYFEDGDKIYVKLRTMNEAGYNFWNSWQNEIINGQSPIFPNTKSLRSNIEGGIGIWEGYGHQTVLVKTPDKK
jgi:hypothetical protein